MQKRWLVKRRQLVVLEATTYTRIYGQQQLGKCWCVARSQPTRKNFRCKVYSCKIFSYVFCVRKYFCNEQKANYSISFQIQSSRNRQVTGNCSRSPCDGRIKHMCKPCVPGAPSQHQLQSYHIAGKFDLELNLWLG